MAIHHMGAQDVSVSDVHMTYKCTSGHKAVVKLVERACFTKIIRVYYAHPTLLGLD